MAHTTKVRTAAWGDHLERSSRALSLSFLAVALLLLLGLLWQQGAERRALMNLPSAERAQVFTREWSNFQQLCASQGSGPLNKRCREKATFVTQFPECRADCQEVVRTYLARPAK